MTGYAATARLTGTSPHLAGRPVPRDRGSWPDADDDPDAIGDRAPERPRAYDQVDSLGLSWQEMTFYLFDPESWR